MSIQSRTQVQRATSILMAIPCLGLPEVSIGSITVEWLSLATTELSPGFWDNRDAGETLILLNIPLLKYCVSKQYCKCCNKKERHVGDVIKYQGFYLSIYMYTNIYFCSRLLYRIYFSSVVELYIWNISISQGLYPLFNIYSNPSSINLYHTLMGPRYDLYYLVI